MKHILWLVLVVVAACGRSHAATPRFADASDVFQEIHDRLMP